MKKKVLACITSLLIVFAVGCSSNSPSSTKNVDAVKQSDTVKQDEFKKNVEEVKNIVSSPQALTASEMRKLDSFIDDNKERDEVKNDLSNFIMEKWEDYLKLGQKNKDTGDKISYALGRLFVNYPDNERVQALYHQYTYGEAVKEVAKQEEEKTSQEKQQPKTNNFVSQDGNLELIDHSSKNGYIVGTIKNNSSKAYRYVEVNINLYDGSGNQVGNTMTNVTNLEAYKSWKFSAVVLEQNAVKSYKIVNIEGY